MGAGTGGRSYYLIYLAALAIWTSMIVLAPVLASSRTFGPASGPIYSVFSWVCHQKENRCLSLHGEPLAACARCTFMYLGVLAGSLSYPLARWPKRPRVRYLLVAATPLIIDGGTQLLGLRESTNLIRAITGFIFGAAMAFFLAPEAVPTVSILISRVKKRGSLHS